MEQSWNDKRMWFNIPFSGVEDTVTKCISDKAHVMLVMSYWRMKKWHKRLQPYILQSIILNKETKVFHLPVREVRRTLWPVQIAVVCAHEPACAAAERRPEWT